MSSQIVIDYVGLIPIILIGAAFILPLIALAVKSRIFYNIYTLLFSIVAFIMSLKVFKAVLSNGRPILYTFGGWPPPVGIVYEVDLFSATIGLLVTSVTLLIVLYSWWYMRGETGLPIYYALLLGLEAGMIGCLYTGDVFNLFVMIEVLAISAYGLVAFYRSKLVALEASIKYAFIGAVATTMYFVAVLFIYGAYGTLNMADIALRARTIPPTSLWGSGLVDEYSTNTLILAISASVATVLALWAFTFKAAVFPNHFWLPDAHPEAPTPISAALSGLVVGIGVYVTVRWLYTIFGPESVLGMALVYGVPVRDLLLYMLMVLGVISSIMAALLMTVQRDVKRLLAYSTISHIGLMFMSLSVGLGSVPEDIRILALTATLYHLINHGVGKSLLFMSTGVLAEKAGTRDITRWNGIGRLYPHATATSIVGIFHLVGIPPLGGFFSKLMMFQAFIGSGMPILAVMLILESIISLIAYIRLLVTMLFGVRGSSGSTSSSGGVEGVELGISYTTLWILTLGCIGLGVMYITGHIPVYLTEYVYQSLSSEGVWSYINTAKELIHKLLYG